MTVIKVLAKSSSGEPYDVEFVLEGDLVKVFCSCPAGIWGKLCKHKLGLMLGDSSLLALDEDLPKLQEASRWLQGGALQGFLKELGAMREEMEALKRKESKLRAKFEQSLKTGFPVGAAS